MNPNRKLAHVEKISWKRPIEGADRIELVGVLGWQCITKKDEFNVGDLCVYIEIDSVVDKDNPNFEFLEKYHFKIKTMKMKGVLSQGIVFPLSILSGKNYRIGDDVTKELKITQIEDVAPTPKRDPLIALRQRHKKLCKNKVFLWCVKFKWFRKLAFKMLVPKSKPKQFPDWIVKTDETRIQSIPQILEVYKGKPMVVTEKLDGTSTSFGLKKIKGARRFDFAVCSRNCRLNGSTPKKCFYSEDVYGMMAAKYNVEEVLHKIMEEHNASTVVLQGETIGNGIQGNKYGLSEYDFYAFNLVIDGEKIDSTIARGIVRKYGIKWVPIISVDFKLADNVEEMVKYADGKSVLYDTLREGLVIRDHENTVSFKCISNQFLLKHNI